MPIKAILTDIEGTTSSISFVKEVLFPYARKHLESYLRDHWLEPKVQKIVETLCTDENLPYELAPVVERLQHWIDTDQKKTALKTLQGFIWQAGYEQGDYQAHLYADTFKQLKNWHEDYSLYVYSSGSIKAQHLFFQYSNVGDIRWLFQDYFDTTTGPKKESSSYNSISNSIGYGVDEILFLSDCPDEIFAAAKAGLKVMQIDRSQSINSSDAKSWPCLHNFEEVSRYLKTA